MVLHVLNITIEIIYFYYSSFFVDEGNTNMMEKRTSNEVYQKTGTRSQLDNWCF